MNTRLLLKMLLLLLVALLLVLMGMNNQRRIDFVLPPILNHVIQQPAALMYAFFAVGLLTGTMLSTGGGGKKGAGRPGKSER